MPQAFCLRWVALLLVATPVPSIAQDLATFRAQREAYIDVFRRTGERPAEPALALEAEIRAALDSAAGASRSSILYELATILRLQTRFDEAVATYRAAIEADGTDGEVVFDAWIGIARAHVYGDKNHGAAAKAFQHAVEAAGAQPTPKQRHDMASYLGQLQAERGENEAALVNTLDALRLAASDADRFYALLDAGGILQNFAESCDYRPIVDSKTMDDPRDGWGACRRAVDSAAAYYTQASATAGRLEWDFLQQQADQNYNELGWRLSMINSQAEMAELGAADVFNAENASGVLVNESFWSGVSVLDLIPGLDEVMRGLIAQSGPDDAMATHFAGIRAESEGDAAAALAHFERAADLLDRERTSHFDLRQRGTAIEDRPEIVRDLALRLLASGSHERAFATFESIRARGLGDLAATFETQAFTDAERRWLASLVDLESRESFIQNFIVESAIAGDMDEPSPLLDELASVRARRAEAISDPGFADVLARLEAERANPTGLSELTEAVHASGVPVIFYWVTHTNVVVWAISPEGVEVKTVFLPEPALVEKVRRVVQSARTPNQPFDAKAARQLHAFLIQPFERHLSGGEAIIVPQGPLVALPFEALIDARSNRFLVEDLALSYAPSATFAAAALQRDPIALPRLTAVYDTFIEDDTGEVGRLRASFSSGLMAAAAQSLAADEVIALLASGGAVHTLLHGTFVADDPLQSYLDLNNPKLAWDDPDQRITAAELLAADWRDARLVVFSACESAQMDVRISNEIYGLSWAPLAGGADAVVTTRWKAQGAVNAEWMPDFYARLAEGGASPATAAAATMSRMIHEGQTHPYFWAAPQVFGR
jgi:CHAT domain-containing protein